MHLLKSIPYIICIALVITLFMTERRQTDAIAAIIDSSIEIQAEHQKAIQTLTETLLEQEEQIADLSRIISEAQEVGDTGFKANPAIPLPDNLQEHVHNEANRIGIKPEILFSLIERESRYQSDAIGYNENKTRDYGLCQINEVTFGFLHERGIDPIASPEQNITAAAELISYYRDERGCTLLEALSAYGCGYSGMKRGEGFEAAKKLLEATA